MTHDEEWYVEKYYNHHILQSRNIRSWDLLGEETQEYWKSYLETKYPYIGEMK